MWTPLVSEWRCSFGVRALRKAACALVCSCWAEVGDFDLAQATRIPPLRPVVVQRCRQSALVAVSCGLLVSTTCVAGLLDGALRAGMAPQACGCHVGAGTTHLGQHPVPTHVRCSAFPPSTLVWHDGLQTSLVCAILRRPSLRVAGRRRLDPTTCICTPSLGGGGPPTSACVPIEGCHRSPHLERPSAAWHSFYPLRHP